MSLSIEDEDRDRLGREPAQRNSETAATADALVVKEELERQVGAASRTGRLEWLLKLSERTAPLFNGGRTSKELVDELYDDETGLPK